MNRMTFYLSMDELLELHKMLIQQFGGHAGVRDMGLVESALHRPQSGYYESLSCQAAALLQSFALHLAMIDGNKRVAWASAAVFLHANGYRIVVSADEAEELLSHAVIQKKISIDEIAAWLEKYMLKI